MACSLSSNAHDLHARSHARFQGKSRLKKWPFRPEWPVWPFKFRVIISFVQCQFSFHAINMVNRNCKHCPIPGCGSKFLVRLANHLTQVHGLSEMERKYWLQFAKLQHTNMVRVYEKEAEPKTIFL